MSIEMMSAVGRADIRPSGRKFVALALANFADEEGCCFPSVEQISAFTAQADKTVRDHLDGLEADGLISRERQRREDGTLGRYRFRLHRRNLPEAQSATGEKRRNPPAKAAAHDRQLEPSYKDSSFPARADKGGETLILAREFERAFWPAYPHKVGKPVAMAAFLKARARADLEAILQGLSRYAAKRDDRPWCNPATWLNQERWADEPGPRPTGPPAHARLRRDKTILDVIDERLEQNHADLFPIIDAEPIDGPAVAADLRVPALAARR